MTILSYQVTLEGDITGIRNRVGWEVGFDICNGEYPDHIKGAAPDDEGEYKGFYQFEAWEARECAVQSTVRAVERVI